MAIIQSIRNRAGVLISIIIGLALFAFILGDFITSGGMIYKKSKMNVAVINGNGISYTEFQKLTDNIEEVMKAQYQTNNLDEAMMESVRNQAWQELLQKYILEKEYDKLGLSISDPEFSDMIQGPNPHPMVMQMFANPETGTLNRLQLSEFLNRIDEITGAPKMVWIYIEDIINKERLFTKYHTLVRKGLYVNKLEAERRQKDMNTTVDISFIEKKYTSLSDSSIVVKESDMKKYYKEYKAKYKQEESRDIKYIAFEVIPSESDIQDAEKWINDIKPEYQQVEDAEQYVNFTSPPYDKTNYKQGELPDTLDNFMFSAKLGDVYGPYYEDGAYKLAKLSKISYLPDSIRVSHILIPVNQQNVQQMRLIADSLLKLANDGYDFGALVEQNSRDAASILSKGDMGWIKEGEKGSYFSDTCFSTKVGQAKLTYSEDGLHVIKVTDQSKPVKKVQVGVLSRLVAPGSKTDQLYYSQAVDFASKNNTIAKFDEAAAKGHLVVVPAFGVKPLDNELQGIPNSRKIIHWAFEEAKEGDLYKEIDNYGGKYIVAIVTKIREAGFIPFEELTDNIKIEILKEKKAEQIATEMQKELASAKSIDAVASAMKLEVNSATGIRFSSYSVQGAGAEPALIAAAVSSEPEKIVGPVIGENGVYILSVENKQVREDQLANIKMASSYMEQSYAARANRLSFEKLKELGKISDQRARFY
jgi:peptidyl-prolyl cis-trans isomerase D